MNGWIAFFAKQRLFGNLISIVVVGWGVYALSQIRRETFPNVTFDVVSVSTAMPGASAEEVERLVTNVIEQEIREVDGIKQVTSTSYENVSSILVQLDPDQTTDAKAKADIQDIMDRLTSLPDSAKKPVVTILETKQQPVIEVVVGGIQDELELRSWARRLESEIESLSDVARVSFRGLRKMEYRVEADLSKMRRLHVSLEEVADALRRQNLSIPAGLIEPGAADQKIGKQRILRVIGDFKKLQDLEATVIRGNDFAQSIQVKDVAKVTFGLQKPSELASVDGKNSIRLTVIQKEKADTIRLVETLRKKIDSLRPSFPKELQLVYVNDVSEFIVRRLDVLNGNLALGLALVLLLLSLVLPGRVALMVSLGIPFAFLGTMIVFQSSDITLNLISLIGLIIVSGMLVDDAIVVTDNAVRLMEEGMDPEEAAIKGTQEVWLAVLASVLTTVVAFIPLMTMSGIFGKFVKPISYGVVIALVVSLFEAFFILPGHIASFIRVRAKRNAAGHGAATTHEGNFLSRLSARSQRYWDERIVPRYTAILSVFLRRRYLVAVLSVVGFIGVLILAGTQMKVVLFPADGIEIFTVQVEAPVGTSLAQHAELLKPIEAKIAKLPKSELDHYATVIGENRMEQMEPGYRKGSEYALILVYLTPERARSRKADTIIEELRKEVGTPEALKEVVFGRVSGGPPVGMPVSLAISGATYDIVMPAVKKLKADLAAMPGVRDIKDTYTLGKEEIQVRLKPNEAAAAGLSVRSIGASLRAAYEGEIATTLRTLDEEIDVRVQLMPGQREDRSQIAEMLIPNAQGNLIRLANVADLQARQGIAFYDHKNYKRVVLVTADVDTKVTSSVEVNAKLKDRFTEFQKEFPGVGIAFGGEDEDTQNALASLVRAFILAFTAIFVILVLTFQSLSQPLLVLLTVPMGIVAVLLAFFTHGWPITFLGMMGIVALAGVIVNNAIVLVDFVNGLRARGVDKLESILQAGTMRVRPVFLTTITTVIGVLPTAYGIGGEDKFVTPLALGLGWGLLFGSLLTVFIFPAAVAILDDALEFWGRRVRGVGRP